MRKQIQSYGEVIAVSQELQTRNLIMFLFAFLLSITLMLYSIDRVTDPMHRLAQVAEELSNGNFAVEDISVPTLSEVGDVVSAFNTMKNDIRQYIAKLQEQKHLEQEYMNTKLRNMKMEQLLKRMELYTMQAQMNPHFLFNTVNTGVQLAIVEDADKTADFMEHLAKFLRHSLREKKLMVSLRHEIEGLKSYLALLRIRFPRSLEVSIDLPEELLDSCTVPALILQPLVENSVIHAFKGREQLGSIQVQGEKRGTSLHLRVSDNGKGIPEATARELLQPCSWDNKHTSKLMGLENVIQRLYFFYPNNPEVISIGSTKGEGTCISININTEDEACITL